MDIKRRRSRTLVSIVILFVLAVIVAGGTLGYFWYRKTHTEQQVSTHSGGSINIDTTEAIETEDIQAVLIIPTSATKAGDVVPLSAFSMRTPKSWRTINAKNLLNTPLENIYATNSNDILAQLIMVPEREPIDPIHASNSLSFYNITSWLAQSTAGNGGTVTPAAKAAYIDAIKTLGEGREADKKACDKGFGVLNTSLCEELLEAKPIASADGKLKGVSFLNAKAPGGGYDPLAMVYMTGKIKDQQILAYGAFHLLDKASHTLSATDTAGIKAAWDSFMQGDVPGDTLTLYRHVVDAVESIKIEAQ